MNERVESDSPKKQAWLRRLMVVLQLFVIGFLVLVALMGSGYLEGSKFFSTILIFFLKLAGIDPVDPPPL